jgi:2-oxoisovalerate dehydrogenase E1 component alpha subunit
VALEPGDMNFPTYRQAGLLIAGHYPMLDMMNQIYSNADDLLKGRQLPVLYSAREHGSFSISGNLATQFIQAVGRVMASAMKRDTRIAVGWTGDGSSRRVRARMSPPASRPSPELARRAPPAPWQKTTRREALANP